jgi:hypothetical protein
MAAPTTPNNNTPFMARLLPGPRHYLGFNECVFNSLHHKSVQIDAPKSSFRLVKLAVALRVSASISGPLERRAETSPSPLKRTSEVNTDVRQVPTTLHD